MPSTVKLQDGETIETAEDPHALVDRFNASRRDGTLIKVDAGGRPVWVNPHALATITAREPTSDAPPSVA